MRERLRLCTEVTADDLPERLQRTFRVLPLGQDLDAFLALIEKRRAGWARTLARSWLRGILSDFDIHALLGLYPMFLLGTSAWRELLGSNSGAHLLDIGAGSGDVTALLGPLFSHVTTTERSRRMAQSLRRRGFDCAEIDLAESELPSSPFDAISCLNVLDRCPKPLSLLRRARSLLRPEGRLIVALALPLDAFYYDGGTTLPPSEPLPCSAVIWEHAAAALMTNVIEPLGLSVEAWTRTPYLSGGDARHPVYELDAAVVVARAHASESE